MQSSCIAHSKHPRLPVSKGDVRELINLRLHSGPDREFLQILRFRQAVWNWLLHCNSSPEHLCARWCFPDFHSHRPNQDEWRKNGEVCWSIMRILLIFWTESATRKWNVTEFGISESSIWSPCRFGNVRWFFNPFNMYWWKANRRNEKGYERNASDKFEFNHTLIVT